MWEAVLVGFALVVGFLAGLLTFRVKQRWCPTCGATLACPDPTYHSNPAPAPRSTHDHNARNAAPAAARHPHADRRDRNTLRRTGTTARRRDPLV